MRTITKFLLAVFSFAPAVAAGAPISTTAGSNLTAYNGALGSVMNNAWNNASNPRANAQSGAAKADYGNCNAVVLRCATPKCSGGGCGNMDVARSIVAGCVNSNSTCKKHGDDLINYIAAQLVSDSVAAQNQQVAAAQAAAAAAADQSAQQIAAMQQQMTQQMQMMQEQNNAQIASLQNALEESRRETADAVAQAAAAGASVASTPDADTGLTAVQTAAAKSGVSEDVIARSTVTGQILTSMEGVDTSLNNLKTTMREAFKYGGCNEINGNNCTGPKRVKKFKELANKFFDPYDSLVDNLDDALTRAQSVGVDMTDIYMMLNGSCNRWGEYICQVKPITYLDNESCDKNGKSIKKGRMKKSGVDCVLGADIPPEYDTMCVLNKELGEEQVKESWLYPEDDDKIRIGCASSALDGSILGRRRSNGKKGAISIDVLELLINQDAPNSFGKNVSDSDILRQIKEFCAVGYNGEDYNNLKSATVSKVLKVSPGEGICCDSRDSLSYVSCNGSCEKEENLAYVNPMFALCNVHAYNAGKISNDSMSTSADKEEMKDIIGLKTTVIAQQMYKQYTSVESMIKRLKVMLEKATLKASLQVAGGSSGGGSSDSDYGDSGSSADITFENCEARTAQSAVDCVRSNYSAMKPMIDKNKITVNIRKQLYSDAQVLYDHLEKAEDKKELKTNDTGQVCFGNDKAGVATKNARSCLRAIMSGITRLDAQIENKKNGGGQTFEIKLKG